MLKKRKAIEFNASVLKRNHFSVWINFVQICREQSKTVKEKYLNKKKLRKGQALCDWRNVAGQGKVTYFYCFMLSRNTVREWRLLPLYDKGSEVFDNSYISIIF